LRGDYGAAPCASVSPTKVVDLRTISVDNFVENPEFDSPESRPDAACDSLMTD
jgi:hypothetical protein